MASTLISIYSACRMGINLRLLCRKEHKTVAIFGRKVMNNRITILGIVVLFLLSLDVARIFICKC